MIYALAGCTVDYSCAWSKVDYITPSRHLLTSDHCRARIFFSEMTCFNKHPSTLIEKQPYEKIMVSIRLMDWELGNSEYIENVTYLYTECINKTCSAYKLDRLNKLRQIQHVRVQSCQCQLRLPYDHESGLAQPPANLVLVDVTDLERLGVVYEKR